MAVAKWLYGVAEPHVHVLLSERARRRELTLSNLRDLCCAGAYDGSPCTL